MAFNMPLSNLVDEARCLTRLLTSKVFMFTCYWTSVPTQVGPMYQHKLGKYKLILILILDPCIAAVFALKLLSHCLFGDAAVTAEHMGSSGLDE